MSDLMDMMSGRVTLSAPKKRGRPEADLAQLVVQYLELDGWRAIKMEPLTHPLYGKGSGQPGMPDYLFLRYGNPHFEPEFKADCEHLWIEFKSARGTVSDKQREWHARERAKGALVLVAKEDFEPTVEAFARWYLASGLARNNPRLGTKR